MSYREEIIIIRPIGEIKFLLPVIIHPQIYTKIHTGSILFYMECSTKQACDQVLHSHTVFYEVLL